MRLRLSFAAVTVALTTASTAALADGPTFGSARQLAISSDANLALTHTSTTATTPGSSFSSTTLTLLPSADYFVTDGLSVGAYVLLQVNSATYTPSTSTTLGIGPRIGYNFTLSDTFSFWPKVGLGIDHTSFNGSGATAITVSIYAPLLVHPAPHFFLGLGPIFTSDLINALSGPSGATPSGSTPTSSTSGPKVTTFGLAFTVGGWVGL
jgi:hypothetical protein